MRRREVLRILATGTVVQIQPRSHLLAMLKRARALAGSQSDAGTLNAHQFATVKTIAEMILPRTDTPGASDVAATEFIDLVLTEWCSDKERALFVDGLRDVDVRSRSVFGKDFVECAPVQQADTLTSLGQQMIEEASRDRSRAPEGQPEADKNFYLMLRRLTLTAYYTSEDGATKETHFQIIPDRHDGCAPISSGKQTQESS